MSAVSTSAEAKATTAGIVERGNPQNRVIPESRRADGTIRKERKVRPGFTPVEDVQRYRPARARQAEEAMKRGKPGRSSSEVTPPASSSSSIAPIAARSTPIDNQKVDSDRKAWRSGISNTSTATNRSPTTAQFRGNFAPLEPPKQTPRDRTIAPVSADWSEDVPSEAKPWRNSRLRRPSPPKQDQDKSVAVSDALDEEGISTANGSDKDRIDASGSDAAADKLAAELDRLRLGNTKPIQDE
ncbi:uncharacterized protein MEPE_06324 [Melanopsichium pennsylvanicum]|uniref:WIBG Mago-binding domain-containing protein n=2 Tax=Melanopsichium pennsylvanicum TaxID=63383 RepID=A0AAJ5C8L2_9BASI|nr:fog: zn-finger [Melanopsichium pennsylvanicum 4]SNX87614.1 uncharacterized protein MEPE_06324 [Melanopsichium pennsylvanicum]